MRIDPFFPRLRRAPAGVAAAAATLGVLAACAWVVQRQTRKAQAENPPQGRFIEVDGLRLHFLERGDPASPALVLLHGNGAAAQEMEISGLVERAARRYRVIVFDRPGYGHSERPSDRRYAPPEQARLLLRALAAIGVEHPIVLGHSWGAMVALAMGLARPEALRALVLVSGYYTPSLRFDVPLLGSPAIPVLGTVMRHTVSPLLARALWPAMLWRIFAPAPISEAFRRRFPVWMALRPGTLRASAAETAMMIPAVIAQRRREHGLRTPTVVVAGEGDRLVSTAWQSQRLHMRHPDTRLRLVPRAGHMVHHTATRQVMAAIEEAAELSRSAVLPRDAPQLPRGARLRPAPSAVPPGPQSATAPT